MLRVPGATEQTLTLQGTAVDQGGYRSLLGAFELGASSPRIPTAKLGVGSDSRMDLQYVGAASNVAALKAAGADTSQAHLSFGISTWGNWQEVTPRGTYYVFVDTDKDGTSDYRLQTVREKGLDYPLVKVSKRSNGKWQAIENALYPLNGTWGDTDTNIMDSNTLVMTVPLSVLGLDPDAESTEISYSVTTSSAFSATTVVDTTDSVVFNYAAPKLWFSGEEAGVPNLFVDAPEAQLVAHRNGDAKNVSALFLHMHNATGDLSGTNGAAGERAQVLRVSSNSEATAASAHFTDVPADYPLQTTLTGWLSVVLRPATRTARSARTVRWSAARWRRSSTVWRVRLSSLRRAPRALRMCRAITRSSRRLSGCVPAVLRPVGRMVRSVRMLR